LGNPTNPHVLLNYQPPLHHEITLVGSKGDIAARVNAAKINSAALAGIVRMIVVSAAIAKVGAVPGLTAKVDAHPAAIARVGAPLATTAREAIARMIVVPAAIAWAEAMASRPHWANVLANQQKVALGVPHMREDHVQAAPVDNDQRAKANQPDQHHHPGPKKRRRHHHSHSNPLLNRWHRSKHAMQNWQRQASLMVSVPR
jgi:hypothetical protein